MVSAVLASMRAYSPAISAAEAELCVTTTERSGGAIDVAAAFDVCGHGSVVQAGLAAMQSVAATSQNQSASEAAPAAVNGVATSDTPPVLSEAASSGTSKNSVGSTETTAVRPLPSPYFSLVSVRRGRLLVRVRQRPRDTLLQVEVMANTHRRQSIVAKRTVASNSLELRVRSASAVRARFIRSGTNGQASRWITKHIG
jgi:hypothetical protein